MDSNHILQLMKHVITYHWLPIVVEGSVNALREFNVVTRPDKYYNKIPACRANISGSLSLLLRLHCGQVN